MADPTDALVALMESLDAAQEQASCVTQDPFIKLGTGHAPTLDYSIPQSTCFSTYGAIRKFVPLEAFKDWTKMVPKNNFFDYIGRMSPQQIKDLLGIDYLNGQQGRADFAPAYGPATGVATATPVLHAYPVANAAAPVFATANNAAIRTAFLSMKPPLVAKMAFSLNRAAAAATNTRIATAVPVAQALPVTAAPTQTYMPPLTAGPKIVDVKALDAKKVVDYVSGAKLMPVAVKGGVGGAVTGIRWVSKPHKPVPFFAIIEEYKTCNYLGNYGAGKTAKTFSLLPGERTTISVRTYRDSSTTHAYSQNILDSVSKSSATEFQNLLQQESGQTNSDLDTYGGSSTEEHASDNKYSVFDSMYMQQQHAQNSSSGWNLGGHLDLNMSILSLGIGGGGGKSKSDSLLNSNGFQIDTSLEGENVDTTSDTTDYSHTGIRSSNANSIHSALDKHVEQSNSARRVDVNTSTISTAEEGEEDTTVRELVNYNKSRVLNFVFRQLLQEYITITYLKNIKIAYCNGYPESVRIVDLCNLENLLQDMVKPEYIAEVRWVLLKHYCKILDYEDNLIDFIEPVVVDYGDCLPNPFLGGGGSSGLTSPSSPPGLAQTEEKFWRVKKGLSETYTDGDLEFTVDGVILKVDKQTLFTSSLVVDALLGQGEALDCYNMKTQENDATAKYLENLTRLQQISTLEAITDPTDKAGLYNKIYNLCCPPVTQVLPVSAANCGCGDSPC